nr:hypothetical protein [uncultured Allomuricauda sp.]
MKKLLVPLFLIVYINSGLAQNFITKPGFFKSEMENDMADKVIKALDQLYQDMADHDLSGEFLTASHQDLTMAVLNRYLISPLKRRRTRLGNFTNQIMHLYPIAAEKCMVSIGHITKTTSELQYQISLIADISGPKITFSNPLHHYARYWKKQRIGNITYHFRESINVARALAFDEKNSMIAEKFGISPDKFDFYMCDDEQEVLNLLGVGLMAERTGQTRNGFGVYLKTICSIMNHEDFSHDVFHYYSGKVNASKNRNWITEEGVAYLWGNAYYTDKNGEMISHSRLVNELKAYMTQNADTDLLDLFTNNTKIFKDIAPEISVTSTISGIFAQEVEDQKGMEGVQLLINCGSKNRMENYFKAIESLLGVTKKNFNKRLAQLIAKYE